MLFDMAFESGFPRDHIAVAALAEDVRVEIGILFLEPRDPYRGEVPENIQHQGTIV